MSEPLHTPGPWQLLWAEQAKAELWDGGITQHTETELALSLQAGEKLLTLLGV